MSCPRVQGHCMKTLCAHTWLQPRDCGCCALRPAPWRTYEQFSQQAAPIPESRACNVLQNGNVARVLPLRAAMPNIWLRRAHTRGRTCRCAFRHLVLPSVGLCRLRILPQHDDPSRAAAVVQFDAFQNACLRPVSRVRGFFLYAQVISFSCAADFEHLSSI